MSDNDTSETIRHEAPTRRDYMKYGGAVVGGGLLAGCAGQSDSGSTPTGTTTDASQDTNTRTEEDTPYEACIEPNGCYTFDEVPETIVTYEMTEHIIALGRSDNLLAAARPDDSFDLYLDQIPGVSFDPEPVEDARDFKGKEPFYEWDADIHLVDHRNAMQRFDLDSSDIDELEANVGPFFGTYTRRPEYDGGVYYDVFEAHERVAAAFQEGSNAEALSEFHADLVEQIRQELPPVSERPSFAFVSSDFWDSGEKFYIWNPTMAGSMTGPLRDIGLGEKDVFAEKYEGSEWGPTGWTADAEALLEADPELIVYKGGFLDLQMDDRDWDLIYSPLRDDPVASEVTAVQEERVYPIHGGPAGPIARPFHTERFAKVLYPDLFGEHPNGNPPYENITEPLPEEDQLFDRQKLADIINGNL